MSISFDRAADYYDETRGYSGDTAYHIRDAILQTVKANPATHFLEIGVGTGRIAFPFIQAGYSYTGIDISQAMMDKLRQKISHDPQAQKANVTLIQGDITVLPFPTNSFEVALSVHVFHLVTDWQKAIDEVRRVLVKPGGILIIGYDNIGGEETPFYTVWRKWAEFVRELGGGDYLESPGDWQGEKVAAYLETSGAKVEKISLVELAKPAENFSRSVERVASRKFSSQWHVPDDMFEQSITRLRRWLVEEIAEPDKEILVTAYFKATVARF
jgi:ubiquinone/menaquinone biosynthesis C-methylase UbiE